VVSAAPALARTVVDFARNAGHVDGLRAIAATRCPPKPKFGQLPPCPKRSGVVVATNARGYLPNDVVLRARDARRLGGLGPKRFAQMCGQGSIAGYAQVPGDVGSSWTEVGGYGR